MQSFINASLAIKITLKMKNFEIKRRITFENGLFLQFFLIIIFRLGPENTIPTSKIDASSNDSASTLLKIHKFMSFLNCAFF